MLSPTKETNFNQPHFSQLSIQTTSPSSVDCNQRKEKKLCVNSVVLAKLVIQYAASSTRRTHVNLK